MTLGTEEKKVIAGKFGAHEGDGACFGFWAIEEEAQA